MPIMFKISSFDNALRLHIFQYAKKHRTNFKRNTYRSVKTLELHTV